MKNIKDIAVIVQARTNSQRIPNKMLRPFANTNLFELVLSKLLKSKVIPKQNIIASVYEDELKEIANNLYRNTLIHPWGIILFLLFFENPP